MLDYVLALMLSLAPQMTRADVHEHALAVAKTANSREEAAMLTVIAFYETTFRPYRRQWIAPFGMTCCFRQSAPLTYWASRALRIMRAARACGRRYDVQLGYFHSGSCRIDGYASRQARTIRRLLQANH